MCRTFERRQGIWEPELEIAGDREGREAEDIAADEPRTGGALGWEGDFVSIRALEG